MDQVLENNVSVLIDNCYPIYCDYIRNLPIECFNYFPLRKLGKYSSIYRNEKSDIVEEVKKISKSQLLKGE